MKYITTLLFFVVVAQGGMISSSLEKRLNGASGYIDAMVIFKSPVDINKMGRGRYKEKIEVLKKVAKRAQSNTLKYIKEHSKDVIQYRTFWVSNAIYIKAKPYIIKEISKFPEVYLVKELSFWHILGRPAHIKEMLKTATKDKTVEWNIDRIKADSVWSYYGLSGNGVDVGILDTGIDPDHPALSGNFSGHFHDAVNHNTAPYDDHGHGTHVAGTIAGGDGPGSFTEDIGIAYNASLSSCKAFDSQGYGADTSILECSQWFVSLKADSGVDIRVISNSWGGDRGDTWMWYDIWNNWRGMDIIPVFAAGNSGPGTGTVGSPGDYPIVIGVGATDNNDDVANFSSRGPAPNSGLYADTTYWSRPDWNFIKPDISAPGAGIRSSTPGGNYDTWDGTSMATPHVTGVIALMFEKNPALDYYQIYNILTNYGVDQPSGHTYPNNDYGWGRLNALLAVENTPSLTGPALKIIKVMVNDSMGNNDGIADPGEHVQIIVKIKNYGMDANNVNATLSLLSEYHDAGFFDDSLSAYGNVSQGAMAVGDGFGFNVDSGWRAGRRALFEIYFTGDGGYELRDTISLRLGTPTYYPWYTYDFSTSGGWETNGTWNVTTSDYHSAPSSYTDSPGGPYENNTHNYLVSASPFDLTDAYFARVVFWHKYNFEKMYDHGYLQVSVDKNDGASWVTIASYTDSIPDWVCDTVDIPEEYMGKNVYIRFLVESDGSVTKDGWYVDDVVLQEDLPLTGVKLVNNGVFINDSAGGNNSNMLDPGENAYIYMFIKNIGPDSASHVMLRITSESPEITFSDDTAYFSIIRSDSQKVAVFSVSVPENFPIGSSVDFYVSVAGDNITDTVPFTLVVGKIYWTGDDTLYIALDNTDSIYTELAPSYENVDVEGIGTAITLDDDERANLTLPFTFKFYNVDYTNVWVCSNGWISFGDDPGTNGITNAEIPAPNAPNALIAGVWDDLDPSSGGGIYYYHDTTKHRFIIQYKHIPYYGDTSHTVNFTIILLDPAYYSTPSGNGDILLQFESGPGHSNFTTGIENETGTIGVEYYYNGIYSQGAESIEGGRAILFTTRAQSRVNEKKEYILFGSHLYYARNFQPVVELSLPTPVKVKLRIFDIAGRRVSEMETGRLSKGVHTLSVDTRNLRKGVYFLSIEAGKYRKVEKFVKVR